VIKPLFGYLLILLLAFVISERGVAGQSRNWKSITLGIVAQILIAFAMINLPIIVSAVECLANGILKMMEATSEGAKFAFGYIGGGDLPFELKDGGSAFAFAFQTLPNVILSAALAAILTHLKILPFVTRLIGRVFKLIFGASEPLGLVAAAKMFLGQCEAPLLVRHELEFFSRSEIFTVLSLAFATASASIMPICALCVGDACPGAMRHIVTSSVIGVFSTMLICLIMMPGGADNPSHAVDSGDVKPSNQYGGFMDAVSSGISTGAYVWWSIVGSLVGTIALVAIVNKLLGLLPDFAGEPITLQRISGIFMYPFVWLLGLQDRDTLTIANVLGTKLASNEMIGYFDLAKSAVSSDSVMKTIYALTNFGNFAAVGITVGAMKAIVPSQSKVITDIVWRAFVAGFIAVWLSTYTMSVFLSL
jgi:CNT family concentrative nucleoside transporter